MATATTKICPLPHRKPTMAEGSGWCCQSHIDQMRDRLSDMVRLWELLGVLSRTSSGGARGRRSGTNTAAPTRLDILALTDVRTILSPGHIVPAAAILLSWGGLLSEERRMTPPRAVVGALNMLRVHLSYVAAQPWVGDLYQELGLIHHTLRHVAGETRVVLGRCQEPRADDPTEDCGGPLYYVADSARPVQCGVCHDSWSKEAIQLAIDQMGLKDEGARR